VSEIRGAATLRGVTVEVCPGGALASLSLAKAAVAQDPVALAETVVEAIALATAQANQRTKHALCEALSGVDPALLGLTQSATLTEQAETTVPDTWQVR
jgi:DNA-binding protein YbaB